MQYQVKYSRWRFFLPLLHFYLELPLLRIRTALMRESFETMSREYIALECSFIKWSFSFSLYDTEKRRRSRLLKGEHQ